jgi:hypothetical protein
MRPLVLRVMPDDNSCLFTAFGGVIGMPDPAAQLRKEVSEHILKNPEKYSKVVLEDEPAVYARKILDPQRWGGAIELECLSELYNMEICSVDVKVMAVLFRQESSAFTDLSLSTIASTHMAWTKRRDASWFTLGYIMIA